MSNDDSALVTAPLEILGILKSIQKSKQLITLSFKSLPEHCITSLLEVDHKNKQLVFDEPNPVLTEKFLKDKKDIEFSLKLSQIPVSFTVPFLRLDPDYGFSYLHSSFPTEVNYPQHRQFYRLRTEFIDDIKATVFLSATKQVPCQLVNISLNGICIRIPRALGKMFREEQDIDDILIELPKQKSFSVSATVKNIRNEKSNVSMIVGLQFSQAKPATEKTIQKFIFRHGQAR